MLLFVTLQRPLTSQANDSWFQNTAARDIHLEQLKAAERFNGRAAMLGIVIGIITAASPAPELLIRWTGAAGTAMPDVGLTSPFCLSRTRGEKPRISSTFQPERTMSTIFLKIVQKKQPKNDEAANFKYSRN